MGDIFFLEDDTIDFLWPLAIDASTWGQKDCSQQSLHWQLSKPSRRWFGTYFVELGSLGVFLSYFLKAFFLFWPLFGNRLVTFGYSLAHLFIPPVAAYYSA